MIRSAGASLLQRCLVHTMHRSVSDLPSIGGKDSMSGTFNDIDVPPTLVSFAVDIAKQGDIVTPELKKAGNKLVRFEIEKDDFDIPMYGAVAELYSRDP